MEKMLVKLYNESNETAEFVCHSILGRGQFSTAYLATRRSDGLDVILKKLTPRHPSATDSVRFRDAYNLQVELLNKTDNTAAPVIGFYQDENDVPWIALQKMTGDTLGKTIFHNLQDLFRVFCGVAKGLGQFHGAGYLMLDLNPNNLFVLSNSGSMEGCYFFDFDAFVSKENLTNLKWIHSTRGFLAPEIKAFQKATELSEAADIFALGASLYYCLTGAIPNTYTYFDCNDEDIREQYKLALTQKVTEKLKAFFRQTLNPLPAERFADWNAVYIALEELSDLADPKNRVKLHSNIILDVGEYYIPTPAQLQQLSDFFMPRLGQKACAVIYGNVSGSGKTTLSKAFAKTVGQYYDSVQFCHYLPEKGWDGVLEQIHALNCSVDANERKEEVLTALRSGTQRTLLIIDNFDQESCTEEIPDLGLDTHLLFTSRYKADGLRELKPLVVDMDCSQELATEIFASVFCGISGKGTTQKQKEIVDGLLEQVGYHTYSADLIARELAQHYPTEEGFFCFRENIHRLWQSKIASRKDRNAGEATSNESYQTHIEILFADVLSKFTDPVETSVLCLFSFDRIWDKELFLQLVGDEAATGRFRGQDAVERLRKNGYITETDTEISVHPLVHRVLAERYKDEEEQEQEQEKFLICFLSNFYMSCRKESYSKVNTGFLTIVDSFARKWYGIFQLPFGDRVPKSFSVAEGIALIHLLHWDVMYIEMMRRRDLDRIPHKKTIRGCLQRKAENLNWFLCSVMDGHRRIYALNIPKTNETFPLIAISVRYVDENCDMAIIDINDILACKGPAAIEQAIGRKKDMVLPGSFCGKTIRDVYRVSFSAFHISKNEFYSIKIPNGVKNLHKTLFACKHIENVDLPETLKSIGAAAFLGTSLKKVYLPKNLEYLGGYAFRICSDLVEVKFAEDIKLKKIDEGTFRDCTALKEIALPHNLEVVGESAFRECDNLENVLIPDNGKLKRIEFGAFESCGSLRSVELPFSVEEIDDCVFMGSGLRELTIKNPALKVNKHSFVGCKELKTINAPKEWKAANRDLLKRLRAYEPDENDPVQ